MTQVQYDDNVLTIDGESMALEYEITQVMEADGIILVVLYPPEGEQHDGRNVIAFDTNGTRLWRSERPEDATSHCFGELYKEGEEVIGWSWNSNEYKIDLETGELENLGYGGK
ncbi:hypothetical protein [Halovivax cerinus]|uniref:Uncharacterized protein n=1 Tax=Halovivax cerinus TaxID=1487865 RepID=A0ABD5NRU3_9EURY|nr:hypothetical protein [Halovivax cerinus]